MQPTLCTYKHAQVASTRTSVPYIKSGPRLRGERSKFKGKSDRLCSQAAASGPQPRALGAVAQSDLAPSDRAEQQDRADDLFVLDQLSRGAVHAKPSEIDTSS